MELKDYRNRLDEIDSQIIALFKERMETVADIAAYKKEHGLPVLAAGREKEILDRVRAESGEELAVRHALADGHRAERRYGPAETAVEKATGRKSLEVRTPERAAGHVIGELVHVRPRETVPFREPRMMTVILKKRHTHGRVA